MFQYVSCLGTGTSLSHHNKSLKIMIMTDFSVGGVWNEIRGRRGVQSVP